MGIDLPDDWTRLIAIAEALNDADDATDVVVVQRLGPDVPYNKVLSVQQAWRNKYDRCAARGLIEYPFRIRRRHVNGGYIIEATRDLTPLIEQAMVDWGETGEPYGE